jgi:hypothetical protein
VSDERLAFGPRVISTVEISWWYPRSPTLNRGIPQEFPKEYPEEFLT